MGETERFFSKPLASSERFAKTDGVFLDQEGGLRWDVFCSPVIKAGNLMAWSEQRSDISWFPKGVL